jgi:hypothetical protein
MRIKWGELQHAAARPAGVTVPDFRAFSERKSGCKSEAGRAILASQNRQCCGRPAREVE